MHAFGGHFRLPDRDGALTSRFAVSENPMVHANLTAICFIEPMLLLIKVLHCGNMDFRFFLLLWPWPWLGGLRIRTWLLFSGDIPDARKWTFYAKAFFRKLSCDRQTDRHDRHFYIPRCFAGGQQQQLLLLQIPRNYWYPALKIWKIRFWIEKKTKFSGKFWGGLGNNRPIRQRH